jgi:hypothetical protein
VVAALDRTEARVARVISANLDDALKAARKSPPPPPREED